MFPDPLNCRQSLCGKSRSAFAASSALLRRDELFPSSVDQPHRSTGCHRSGWASHDPASDTPLLRQPRLPGISGRYPKIFRWGWTQRQGGPISKVQHGPKVQSDQPFQKPPSALILPQCHLKSKRCPGHTFPACRSFGDMRDPVVREVGLNSTKLPGSNSPVKSPM